MESTVDLEALAGKEVTLAFALHDLEFGWLRQVVFLVEDVYLVITVDADTDEVLLSLLPELDFTALEQQFSRTQISNQRKRISWLWRMTNQRGYEDGFQVEFDDAEGTNVQLVAEESRLYITMFRRG
ncbi:DUF6334 family protein [Pontibacter russatus]|uniref:DUF6334 family protein n=1 Tax=Pontibacter russatus TaxID=2694929 RepID=UPI001379A514|nr:DUF6334 family protein [Pontibacter russatus]